MPLACLWEMSAGSCSPESSLPRKGVMVSSQSSESRKRMLGHQFMDGCNSSPLCNLAKTLGRLGVRQALPSTARLSFIGTPLEWSCLSDSPAWTPIMLPGKPVMSRRR